MPVSNELKVKVVPVMDETGKVKFPMFSPVFRGVLLALLVWSWIEGLIAPLALQWGWWVRPALILVAIFALGIIPKELSIEDPKKTPR